MLEDLRNETQSRYTSRTAIDPRQQIPSLQTHAAQLDLIQSTHRYPPSSVLDQAYTPAVTAYSRPFGQSLASDGSYYPPRAQTRTSENNSAPLPSIYGRQYQNYSQPAGSMHESAAVSYGSAPPHYGHGTTLSRYGYVEASSNSPAHVGYSSQFQQVSAQYQQPVYRTSLAPSTF